MRASFLIVLLFISFLALTQTQGGGKIAGQINCDSKSELTGATVALLRASDSSAIKYTVAGKDGSFVFENITEGKYLVSVTAVGYQKSYSTIVELTAEKTSFLFPAIFLPALPKSMKTVTITAKRPLIEQKIDRMVVNVDASVTNTGNTALEILEKSPGISVDKDGNISLKGKEGVTVMIDGRPTQLGSTDLANLLRNLTANQLDQIEIMTNPPARYDAAGNAGVINIKTKKDKTAGYNGSITLGYSQGRYPKTNEGFNFNYRQGKVNLFANLSHNYRQFYNVLTIQRNLRNEATKELENYFDQRSDKISEGSSYNAKIGADYFVTKKTTVGIAVTGFYNPSSFKNRNETSIATPSKELQSTTRARVDNTSKWKNWSANLNFRTVLDSAGREFTTDIDYIAYDATNDQFMSNDYFDPAENSLTKGDTLLGYLPQVFEIVSARMDYVHPLNKKSKLEAGMKSSLVNTDNNAAYDSIQYGYKVHDNNRSNHFLYEENINAAYINLSKTFSKKWSSQFGLRLENTNAKGNQLTTGERFSRHYTQLFPTAYLQYKLNEKNSFGLNYGRRIRRPNYESLNPFIRFMDRYTYTKGNPNLKPQFSQNIELAHTYRNILTTTLNYTATNDIIQGVIEQKGREAYATQANIASLRQFGIAFNVNHSLTKWWTNSMYLNVYTNRFKGIVNNEYISLAATSFSLNGSQQFKLSKTFSAELSGFYRSAVVQGVLKIDPRGSLSVGFSQQILDNKGSIRLSISDIFYTQQSRAVAYYGNVDAAFQERGDSRVVNLGFTYRFSKGKLANQRKRGGSAGEEQSRVGVD